MQDAVATLPGSGSVKCVAHSLGYSQSAHFTRDFKEAFGILPYYQRLWNRVRNAAYMMNQDPEISYRCGTLALRAVARATNPGNPKIHDLPYLKSPEGGFSMLALLEIANQRNLGLIPVARVDTDEIPVPSVIHLAQLHYAAILQKHPEKEEYLMVDPTSTSKPRWISAAAINEEASGFFLIPQNLLKVGWIALRNEHIADIFGKGLNGDNPFPKPPCPPKECCQPGGGCQGCKGMAQWNVYEPEITLSMEDTPLEYTTSRGTKEGITLSYAQYETRPVETYTYSFGLDWNSLHTSYLEVLDYVYPATYQDWTQAKLFGQNGGEVTFYNGYSDPDKFNQMTVERTTSGGNPVFIVHYADGAKGTYAKLYSVATGIGYFYLTEYADARNVPTAYSYSLSGSTMLLTNIADVDGNNIRLTFNTSFNPARVASAISTHLGTVTFSYDSSGRMTNIQDVVGINSGFAYTNLSGDYFIQRLSTPYGNTYFEHQTGDLFGENAPTDNINRYIKVVAPDGGTHLYLYRDNSQYLWRAADYLWWTDNVYTTGVPDGVPIDDQEGSYPYKWFGLSNVNMEFRNSFYWGPRQYSLIANTIYNMSTNDYLLARVQHWAHDEDNVTRYNSVSHALSWKRDFSPGSGIVGHMTWYGYTNQVGATQEGGSYKPSWIAEKLPNGETRYVHYQYNSLGHIILEKSTYTLSNGTVGTRQRTNNYAANGIDLIREYDYDGTLVRSNQYNAYHQVTKSVEFPGNSVSYTTLYSYNDTTHQQTGVTRPSGLVVTNIYNGSNRLIRTEEVQIFKTNLFEWAASGLLSKHTNELGLVKTYSHDNLARITNVAYSSGGNEAFLYKYLDLVGVKDRNNAWTWMGYDSLQRKTSETNKVGKATRWDYCACGSVNSMTDPIGRITSYTYDNAGRKVRTLRPDGSTAEHFSYNLLGQLVGYTNALGYKVFAYANQGMQNGITNAAGTENFIFWNKDNKKETETDSLGVSVTFAYDKLGRLISKTYPDSGVERFGYSERGVVAWTNQLNFVSRSLYDQAGRKTSETNANSEVIQFKLDAQGNLTNLIDGKTQKTYWRYDVNGRLTNKIDNAGASILRYAYDPSGFLTSRWSTAKGTTYYTNDSMGRVTYVNYPASTDIQYSYDAAGKMTNMVDAAGTTVFSFNTNGLLSSEDGPWASDTVSYIYRAGYRTNLTLTQPSGSFTHTYIYDSSMRVKTNTGTAGEFIYTYKNASGFWTNISLAGNGKIVRSNDSSGRILGTWQMNGAGTLLDYNVYAYNTGNQRTKHTRGDGSYYSFLYDSIGQLKVGRATNSSGVVIAAENRGFVYDAAWNLNYRTNNATLHTFGVDSLNQLTSTPGGTTSYDGNGNLTLEDTAQIGNVFTDENQWSSTTGGGTVYKSEFVYDGLGRRRKTIEYTWSGSSWLVSLETRYVYDGNRVVQERNSSNIPQVSYARGNDLSGTEEGAGGIGSLLGRYTSSRTDYYHSDGNGNITALMSSGGTNSAGYRYDPYGNQIHATGAVATANLMRFSSKEYHLTSGTYYYLYRFYDPYNQRWLNRDPIEEDGGINLYTFVDNSPPNRVDPYGNAPMSGGIGGPQFIPPGGFRNPNLPWPDWVLPAALIVGDCVLGGPTGEGIGPAMAMMGGKEAFKKIPAFKRWFHKCWKPKNKCTSKGKSNPDQNLDDAWDDFNDPSGPPRKPK